MKTVEKRLDELSRGDHICVWALSDRGHMTHGQGGTLIAGPIHGRSLVLQVGNGDEITVDLSDRVTYPNGYLIEQEIPHDPSECLNYGPDCEGAVDLYTTGNATRAFPRCRKHQEDRWASYENSIERYAGSDVVPDWFDSADAGEAWFPEEED